MHPFFYSEQNLSEIIVLLLVQNDVEEQIRQIAGPPAQSR